jgi:hypothetical protein
MKICLTKYRISTNRSNKKELKEILRLKVQYLKWNIHLEETIWFEQTEEGSAVLSRDQMCLGTKRKKEKKKKMNRASETHWASRILRYQGWCMAQVIECLPNKHWVQIPVLPPPLKKKTIQSKRKNPWYI